jgi:plastocyanin
LRIVSPGDWATRFMFCMLILLLLAPACGRDENRPRRRSTPTPTAEARSPSPAGQSPGAPANVPENEAGQRRRIGGVETVIRGQASTLPGSVEIEVNDNFFKPNILTGIPDTAIVATVSNKGSRQHNFSVTGQQVDQDLKAGEAPSVVFNMPASGRVVFFCKFHREDGMVGELQVT